MDKRPNVAGEEPTPADSLRAAEERYRSLVERIPAVTYIEDWVEGASPAAGNPLSYVSPQVKEILGIDPEERMKDPSGWMRYVHPDDLSRVVDADRRANQNQTPFVEDYRVVRDGQVRWVHEDARLMEAGGKKYWLGIAYDITDRVGVEERLADSLAREQEALDKLKTVDQLKTTFLHAVSHDLRTPLASIYGLALTLEREDIDFERDEIREFAHRISSNAKRLDRLVSDLLDVERLQRGLVSAERSPTDVGALVRGVVREIDPPSHTLHVLAEPAVASIDRPKVERIVDNLVSNAIRHTPLETEVWVSVSKQDGCVVITVEDQGPGVPEDKRSQIFEPFSQVGPELASPGLGVGLSLVRSFAEMHGGRAWVEEREEGGARFKVTLPEEPSRELDGPHNATGN